MILAIVSMVVALAHLSRAPPTVLGKGTVNQNNKTKPTEANGQNRNGHRMELFLTTILFMARNDLGVSV